MSCVCSSLRDEFRFIVFVRYFVWLPWYL